MTPGGGPACLSCHTSGGSAGSRTDYIDALFVGVGSDNLSHPNRPTSAPPLIWSQHGGFEAGGRSSFVYTYPYTTKATNDCMKCHGDKHWSIYSLIDADPLDGTSFSPQVGMQDNTPSGILNANAFCLSCHDGSDTPDVQVGGKTPTNVASNWTSSGHGRAEASGAYTVSGNNPAHLKCIDCHEVHGSNHAHLLPAKKNETNGEFLIPSGLPEKSFRSGASTLLARDIDFSDYSAPQSGNQYGTSGDPGNQHAPSGATTGFCDACHRYQGRTENRLGTDNTTNKAHTHEGIAGVGSPSSEMTFTKDCVECHDVHGAGNIEMVRGTIAGYALTFTSRTGGNSFDNGETGSSANVNSVCVVCHKSPSEDGTLNVDHNYRTSTVNPDHNEGANCISCHPHGNASDAAKFGFPQAACAQCHGNIATGATWPDNTTGYPDRRGKHGKHVDAIASAKGWTTIAEKNGTCIWCHPDPGEARKGTSPQEASHNEDAPPLSIADVHQDGRVSSDSRFLKLNGAIDNNGTFNGATHTCTNINCHGSGTTPVWNGDETPPATIANLAAAPGGEWGTVLLRWTAPGDDGNAGTAHHYEVRYRVGDNVTAANWASCYVAGTPPAPVSAGDNQAMTVTGLLPDNTTVYRFGIRAYDEAGNASGVSNSPGSKAAYDNIAPLFDGIASAAAATDSGGTVVLGWNAATDNTLPITYRIWWSDNGAIGYGGAPNAATTGLDYRVTGLVNGKTYTFAVRAADNVATPNVDGNTTTLSAVPNVPSANYPANKALYLRRSNAVSIFPGLSTDMSEACGVASGIGFPASPVPPSTAGFGDVIPGKQGLLVDNTIGACPDNAANYTYNTNLWNDYTWRWGQAFYYNTAFLANPAQTDNTGAVITGSATGNSLLFIANYYDYVQVRFAAVAPDGTYTLSPNAVNYLFSAVYPVTTFVGNLDLSSLKVTVPSGGKFAVFFAWYGYYYNAAGYCQVGLDGHTSLRSPVLNVNLNTAPSAPAVTEPPVGSTRSGTVSISWSAATDPNGNPLHYDVYGSTDNGATYTYVIATNVAGTSTTWNTAADQVGLNAPDNKVRIRVEAGDGVFHTAGSMSGSFTVDNRTTDSIPPGTIANLAAATVSKIGAVRLTWTAPGDDNTTGQASRYDIRFAPAPIVDNALFAAATVADNTRVPGAAGSPESIEITGLSEGETYFFAVKTADEVPNWSNVSNSPSAKAGANCGVCHSSPPIDAATKGSHDKHGTTQADCAKCHGTASAGYTTIHSDGILQLGFRTSSPDNLALPPSLLQVAFRQSGQYIYQDNTGGGGADWFTGTDNVDNGTCMSFNQPGVNATGCHGSGRPVWGNPASSVCGTCHGTPGRTGYLDASGDADGSPPSDLSGTNDNTTVGKHLEHLDISYYETGNSCGLCHNGAGKGSYLHGDGATQVIFHPAAGQSAVYDCVTHSCSSLAAGCHSALPWDNSANPACTYCHTGFTTHTTRDRTSGTCTDCHPGGSRVGFTRKHRTNGGTSGIVLVPLPPSSWSDPSGRLSGTDMRTRLGIDYGAMNGIHLGGDSTSGTTEAEICWNCHKDVGGVDTFGVSEWGYNTKTTPSGFPAVYTTFPLWHDATSERINNGYIYSDNNASSRISDWTAGYWIDEYDNTIRRRVSSVHTASFDSAGQSSSVGNNIDGNGAVTVTRLEELRYIRCSYCHDVHGLRKAQGAASLPNPLVKPWLRGTWTGNPYPPEIPPRSTYSYPSGAPRNGIYQYRGGFFIDQNSNWPTNNQSMNTLAKTAGLCTLCHGGDVDNMKFYPGSKLWLPGMINGHSNSTLGGNRTNRTDIFDAGRGASYGMGMQEYAGSAPCLGSNPYACKPSCPCPIVGNIGWYGTDYYNWYTPDKIGGAQGPDSMAHKFTCSKCHNPHAAGLPALLVQNCIDTGLATPLNTDTDSRAVNCHRKTSTTDGWHRLAPGQ